MLQKIATIALTGSVILQASLPAMAAERPIIQFLGASTSHTQGGVTTTKYDRPIPLDSNVTSQAARIHFGNGQTKDIWLIGNGWGNWGLDFLLWGWPNNHVRSEFRDLVKESAKANAEIALAEANAWTSDLFIAGAYTMLLGGAAAALLGSMKQESTTTYVGLGSMALFWLPMMGMAWTGPAAREHTVNAVRIWNEGQ